MNHFLNKIKTDMENIINSGQITVVIGNESCDLDSAVSSLIYAYYLNNQHKQSIVIPILNITRSEFPLRTETKYFLNKLCIDTTKLIFRDDLDLFKLAAEKNLQLVLVDHHVLPDCDKKLENNVIEVIDHRPIDKNWINIPVNIKLVGSCATLIAEVLLKTNLLDNTIAQLLHGTIILDTINFNKKANRFTQLDVDVISQIEKQFQINYSREQIYQELTSARSDVSSLTPFQILHRDMKIIHGVPFLGVPMLIQDFLKLANAELSFEQFCDSKKCKVVVVLGLVTKDNVVFRDIGVYCKEKCSLGDDLIKCLNENAELMLTEVCNSVKGFVLFSQGNVTASRKHIVPILSPVIINKKEL